MTKRTFSKAEYESGEAFRYLDGIADPARKSIEKQRIAKEAKKIGVESFVRAYNDYCKASQEKKPGQMKTQFAGQPKLNCGQYICNDEGIVKDGKLVCSQPIYPSRSVINVEDRHRSVEIMFKDGATWRTIILPMQSIASASEIVKLSAFGVPVTSENARKLGTYISEIEYSNRSAERTIDGVSRMGWVNGSFAPYGKEVVFDGSESNRKAFEALSVPGGSFDVWLRVASKLRIESPEARFVLAASFASAILDELGVQCFVLHEWGVTGRGKTVLLMFAASVWGDPDLGGGYVQTFDATTTGMEVVAAFLHHIPLLLDELQIAITDNDNVVPKIFKLCEGKSRARSSTDLTIRNSGFWRLVIITTGEQMIVEPDDAGGANARSIQIELRQEIDEKKNLPRIAEALKANYGHAGRRFVEAWAKADKAALKREFDEVRDELIKREANPKQAASIAAIYLADKFAGEHVFQADDALDVDRLMILAGEQAKIDPDVNHLQKIMDMITMYKETHFGKFSQEVWGEIDEGKQEVHILTHAFNKMAESAHFSVGGFKKWANYIGVTKTNKGRPDHTVSIRGSRPQKCITIDMNKARDILSE